MTQDFKFDKGNNASCDNGARNDNNISDGNNVSRDNNVGDGRNISCDSNVADDGRDISCDSNVGDRSNSNYSDKKSATSENMWKVWKVVVKKKEFC